MGERDPCKSVLDKIFDCVNSGFNWTTLQIKSACPHKRKKIEEESRERDKGRDDDREKGRDDDKEKGRDYDREKGTDDDREKGTDDDKDDVSPSVTPRMIPKPPPYTRPGEICPPVKPRCFIKMQDPCAPCCCETKPKPPPCPPKHGPQEPREPICGCELCQKNPNHEKCCDKSKTLRGITIDRGHFEKA